MRIFIFLLCIFLLLSPLWWMGIGLILYYCIQYTGYEFIFVGLLLDGLLGPMHGTIPFLYTGIVIALIGIVLVVRPMIFIRE